MGQTAPVDGLGMGDNPMSGPDDPIYAAALSRVQIAATMVAHLRGDRL